MTFQHFILSLLCGVNLVFGLYYLFAVIYIHKKILDKHFYFVIACLSSATYIFFQLLLSLNFSDQQYLLILNIKIASGIVLFPFYLLNSYECFFQKSKKYLAYISLALVPLGLLTIPLNLCYTLPIKSIEFNSSVVTFLYHTGKPEIGYKLWILSMIIPLIGSLLYFIISKNKNKRAPFLLIIVFAIIALMNDVLILRQVINGILVVEYYYTIIIVFMFIEFLKEDRKTYISVVDLSKQLQKEKDEVVALSKELENEKNEAVRRLKITEIYTRKSLVESIEKGEDPTKFQPNNVQIATLFTDIRDFTGISEGLQPLEVVELLNSYFNRMNSTIIKHKGEIDKLMGDCIMALFKDPDDALKSAIEIRTELAKFNLGTHQRQINNGIGLNYGEVIIGNIGSESKMDYTVVGDIVNTASRLEALTKYYKVPLIISEDLKVQLKDSYHIRFLDEALIKGKSTPVKIYEVYDFESDEKKETRERNHQPMQEAFALYQKGEFINAKSIYDELAVRNGDPSLSFYIKRCKNLQSQKDAGLLKDWNGVFEFMDK